MARFISGVPNTVVYLVAAGAVYYIFFMDSDRSKTSRFRSVVIPGGVTNEY